MQHISPGSTWYLPCKAEPCHWNALVVQSYRYTNGFRGVDWWLELNNLYTKVLTQISFGINWPTIFFQVIFCGKGSNRTLTHIINQSSLIDTYHMVHTNIEKNFAIPPSSTQHAPTNMANTLQELHKRIRIYHCHHSSPGSHVEAEVQNAFKEGLAEYYQVNSVEIDSENGNGELGSLEIDDFDAMWCNFSIQTKRIWL